MGKKIVLEGADLLAVEEAVAYAVDGLGGPLRMESALRAVAALGLNLEKARRNLEERLKAEFRWAEEHARCGDCGETLTLVRPGKHQCDNEDCISNCRTCSGIGFMLGERGFPTGPCPECKEKK